jgi:tRNA(Ile2) C34 agmatinyltransferase TiaS
VQRWRRKHKQATLTEIENTVDNELAKMRARIIQDLALASETADLRSMGREERPKCPQCGRPLAANGQQKRGLITDYEQEVELKRSKGYCRHCKLSFFPSG